MSLKLKFNPDLEYQKEAINAVVDLFRGQTPKNSEFTVVPQTGQITMEDRSLGLGNKLDLSEEQILENLRDIQERNGLKQSTTLSTNPYMEFEIDMETGTGKTYVFLRTIMELNKHYGFKKFIIVVPSLAIKEGIHHSLKITEDHFKSLYKNEIYDYFVYDSDHLDRIDNFATADHISIMIINIQAFNRSFANIESMNRANIIHRANDRGPDGGPPIELIQETNPIVIIDEPQSAANTARSRKAIASLNPLCCIKYSATHINPKNVVYRLNAVDAYNLELVKQIEVVSFEEQDNFEEGYIRLIRTGNPQSGIYADIEIDKKFKTGIRRVPVRARHGDDLYVLSGERDVYNGYQIAEIDAKANTVRFTARPDVLTLEHYVGGLDDDTFKRLQIKATIENHLDKELTLNKKGIKVLSLFFIDRVSNYRIYNDDGTYEKGKYAKVFEELYKEIIMDDKYKSLREDIEDVELEAAKVHHGYFSQDKAGRQDVKFVETKTGNAASDDYAYELIMKDKERLLSFDSDLKFIFSHSALREGWDNPNVFQICTLNETYSDIKKRQEIGRGLRLAVNQEGERQYGFDINTLTVIANESYEVFSNTLQREYEEEAGIKFGIIEEHTYANLIISKEDEPEIRLGLEGSKAIVESFKENEYITADGKVTERLKIAIDNKLLEVPIEYKSVKDLIEHRTKIAIEGVTIKKQKERKKVELNKERYISPEFKELWDKIKYKTLFQVDFCSKRLIEECIIALKEELSQAKRKIIRHSTKLDIKKGGITSRDAGVGTEDELEEVKLQSIPDVVTYVQNETDLTRNTIIEILIKSDTLDIFRANPQVYMHEASNIINMIKERFIVDGIKYTKLGSNQFYAQELFKHEELSGYLNDNLIPSKRGLYKHVVFDSQIEENFVRELESNDRVLIYVKLPGWFKIPTPLGGYNPDWAILISEGGEKRFYFIAETKSTLHHLEYRSSESKKIKCGKEHFKAISKDVGFITARKLDDVLNKA
ncbi:MAG: DEAD/DEAH box helicase family protein [Clostridiales bacterium]|nr:DEAD/DEAH box helicase family protein [Clostridiales bacterium]